MGSRHKFGGDHSAWAFNFNGPVVQKSPSTVVTFYTALTGGTQITDLTDTAGNPITSVTTDSNGEMPEFYGPASLFTTKIAADGNGGNGPRRWLLAADLPGLYPSGDTTGATDTTNINNQYTLGVKDLKLLDAVYYINGAIIIPPYASLVGSPNASQVSQTNGGTVISIASGYTGTVITDGGAVTLKAAILMYGQTFGGYATTSEEQKIRDIMIDGTNAPASVQGVMSYGRVSRVQMERVLVSKCTGDGVQQNLDVAGNQPDAWTCFKVFSRYNGGKGYLLRSADSTWSHCLSSNNGDTGTDWFINTTSNSKYIACRSEHSAGIGFGYVCTNSGNSSGGVMFVGCSTDQSALHGCQVGGTINSVVSFAHATPVLFSGCVFRRDGQNAGAGGNYAGLYVHGYGATSGGLVTVDGCQVWPGVNDDGSGALTPNYGVWVDNASKVAIGGGSQICAATGGTAIFDDSSGGANTINYDNTVTTGVGATGTMSITMSPNLAAYQGKSLSLVPGSAPATDPLFINSANASERAFGIRVVGQNNDRIKIDSSGKVSWGPGTATQDVAIARTSTGTLQLTDAGTGNSVQLGLIASSSQSANTSLMVIQPNASGDNALTTQLSGDSNARFLLDSNGKQVWGSGAATRDVALQRSAAGTLKVTDNGNANSIQVQLVASSSQSGSTSLLLIQPNASGNNALTTQLSGDTNGRYLLDSNGKQAWGSGAATRDVALQRPSAGILSVTDNGNSGSAMIRVSASASQSSTTELFSAVCNASGDVAYIAKVSGDSNNRFTVDSGGTTKWGPGTGATDTTLARTGVGALTLTGALTATGQIKGGQATPVNFKPADPNTTVSLTDVMAGYGSAGGGAVAFTPASSGKVLVIVHAECSTATAVTFVNVGGRYGTGTAPNNGDAVTGTRFGTTADYQPRGSGISNQTEFGMCDILSLTAGTAYWFDLGFSTGNASDAAKLKNASFNFVELY